MPTNLPRRRRAVLPLLAAGAALALSPAAAHAGVALSTSGWEWSDPSPQGYTLSDVQFAGARGYAVGSGGTALRTDDGGATWSGLFTGTGAEVRHVQMITPDAIAVSTGNASNSCALRISTDGGQTFKVALVGDSETGCTDTSSFASYDFTSLTTAYVMRTGGAVIATTDGGDSFGSRSAVDGGTALKFDGEIGFATSSNGRIYRTTDGAQTWTPATDTGAPLTHLAVTGPKDLVAWGPNHLVRSTDGGTTWTAGAIAGDPARVSWSDPQHLAFVSNAKLLLSDDGGASVREVTLGNSDVVAAAYVDATHLVAVGLGGVTYLSGDGGANFTRLSTDPVGSQIRTLRATAGGPVGLGDGKIARRVNGAWVVRSTLTSAPVADADFSSPDHGYVLREGNTLLRTANNGLSWSPVDPGTTGTIDLVVTPTDDTTLLFGRFGILRATLGGAFQQPAGKLVRKWVPGGARSTGSRVVTWSSKAKVKPLLSGDAGKSWKALPLPKGITRVDDLTPLPGHGLLLESRGRLFRSTSDRPKWIEVNGLGTGAGQSSPDVVAATPTEWFAGDGDAWDQPVVLHTVNAGKTWTPQALGADDTSVFALAATGAQSAFALSGGSAFKSAIFATTTGGSRGVPTKLSLAKTKSKLVRSGGRIRITGQLTGGKGGERVHVAIRKAGSSSWASSEVTVGANGGGSFTASFKATKGAWVAVAQWAGDSGRAGTGTPAKALTVK